jgi:hypothetical protein
MMNIYIYIYSFLSLSVLLDFGQQQRYFSIQQRPESLSNQKYINLNHGILVLLQYRNISFMVILF